MSKEISACELNYHKILLMCNIWIEISARDWLDAYGSANNGLAYLRMRCEWMKCDLKYYWLSPCFFVIVLLITFQFQEAERQNSLWMTKSQSFVNHVEAVMVRLFIRCFIVRHGKHFLCLFTSFVCVLGFTTHNYKSVVEHTVPIGESSLYSKHNETFHWFEEQ